MPFYDIMLLYRAYEESVTEEKKQEEMQREEYEEQMPDYKNFSSDIQKQVGNYQSSFPNISGNDFKIPEMPSIPSIPSIS